MAFSKTDLGKSGQSQAKKVIKAFKVIPTYKNYLRIDHGPIMQNYILFLEKYTEKNFYSL